MLRKNSDLGEQIFNLDNKVPDFGFPIQIEPYHNLNNVFLTSTENNSPQYKLNTDKIKKKVGWHLLFDNVIKENRFEKVDNYIRDRSEEIKYSNENM